MGDEIYEVHVVAPSPGAGSTVQPGPWPAGGHSGCSGPAFCEAVFAGGRPRGCPQVMGQAVDGGGRSTHVVPRTPSAPETVPRGSALPGRPVASRIRRARNSVSWGSGRIRLMGGDRIGSSTARCVSIEVRTCTETKTPASWAARMTVRFTPPAPAERSVMRSRIANGKMRDGASSASARTWPGSSVGGAIATVETPSLRSARRRVRGALRQHRSGPGTR